MRPYTDAELAILTAASVSVSVGCELLDTSLAFVEDISDDLLGGTVEWALYDDIHRACTLLISRTLSWGVDLVRPYMTLTAGSSSARFDLGVYVLTTPLGVVGETPQTFDVQGYDRLRLLQRQVGADYSVAAGTTYRTAILDAFTAAGLSGVLIDGVAADNVLPAARSWPLVANRAADPDQTDTPVTYLRIVNDLLRAISFRAVYCDEGGLYRCEAYRPPSSRAPEFVMTADDENATVVGEVRTVSYDVWSVPNRWVFRATNFGTGVEGNGVYTYPATGKLDDGRDLAYTSVIDYEAATQAKLVELGDRRVAIDLAVARRVKFPTGPLPIAGHADVVTIVDAAAGLNNKAQAVSWSMPLDGGDMSWTFEVVA